MAEPAPQTAPQTAPRPAPQTAPQTAQQRDGAAPAGAAQFGWQPEELAFVLPFGTGLKLSAEMLGGGQAKYEVPAKYLPPLPGLSVDSVTFDPKSTKAMVAVKGMTAIPLTEARGYNLDFGRDGKPAKVAIKTQMTPAWMGKPDLALSWAPETGLVASVTAAAAQFVPKSLSKVSSATGDVALTLADGTLSGALDTTVTVKDVVQAQIKGAFAPDGLAATVDLLSLSRFIGAAKGQGSIDAAGVLTARLDKQAGELTTPVPGLTFKGGTLALSYNADATVSGGFTDLALSYAGIADATATFLIEGGK